MDKCKSLFQNWIKAILLDLRVVNLVPRHGPIMKSGRACVRLASRCHNSITGWCKGLGSRQRGLSDTAKEVTQLLKWGRISQVIFFLAFPKGKTLLCQGLFNFKFTRHLFLKKKFFLLWTFKTSPGVTTSLATSVQKDVFLQRPEIFCLSHSQH